MAKPELDRNLLFGLVGLQNGLFDQDALVTAFQGWVREKSRPLADRLVDQGALDRVQCAVIQSLVALHVDKNGGDTERSVAETLSLNATLRDELMQSSDPDIRSTMSAYERIVGTVGATNEFADDTQAYPARVAPSPEERFQILRFHAEGGLGEVFLAHDRELNRDVALKQIKGRQAHDPDSRAQSSSARRKSPVVWSIRELSLSTDSAASPTAARSTPCGLSMETRSNRQSPTFTPSTARPLPTQRPAHWRYAACSRDS